MDVTFETWLQGASALFTAIAAIAAAWAAWQVKAPGDEERRLRILAHLKTIHGVVSELGLLSAKDPVGIQAQQLRLRAEVTVVFVPLPKCAELAGTNVWDVDGRALHELVREAMDEVERAQRDVWKDVRRWSRFRRRPVTSIVPPPGQP